MYPGGLYGGILVLSAFGLAACNVELEVAPERGDPAAEQEVPERAYRSQDSALGSGPLIYVDDDAPDGGDGKTRETAFNDVVTAVASACADYEGSWGRPTVLVLPGHYIIDGNVSGGQDGTPRIHPTCAINIWGEEPVNELVRGRAVGPRSDADSFATLEAVPPLHPQPLVPGPAEPMFLFTTSADVRRLNLDGGHDPATPGFFFGTGHLIQVGGGTGDFGELNPLCPSTASNGRVRLDDVALSNVGIGVSSSYMDIGLSRVYADGTGISATINGGPDVESYVIGCSFVHSGGYGLGLYGSALYGGGVCAYDVDNHVDTEHTSWVVGNYIGSNGFPNGLGGMRQLVKLFWNEQWGLFGLPTEQPNTVARLNVYLVFNTFEGNAGYQTLVDMVNFDFAPLDPAPAPAHYRGTWLYNQFIDSERADAFFGHIHASAVTNYVDCGGEGFPEVYPENTAQDRFQQSSIYVNGTPFDYDFDNPAVVCATGDDLANCDTPIEPGNELVFNHVAQFGREVTALPRDDCP